jgi:hypothetical protein
MNTLAIVAILLCGFLPGIVAGVTVAAVLWHTKRPFSKDTLDT